MKLSELEDGDQIVTRLELREAVVAIHEDMLEIKKQINGLRYSMRWQIVVPSLEEPSKPAGGRVWVQYVVEVTDAVLLANTHPELVTITLKQGPAQDFAKALDEAGKPMVCPGLRMRKQTRTSFMGAAAIRIDRE